MIETKLIELRDHATCISAIAVRISPPFRTSIERFLCMRAGIVDNPCVFMASLNGNKKFTADAYDHGDRTWTAAHDYIDKNWNQIQDCRVVDVRFILGETKEPCKSEKGDYL